MSQRSLSDVFFEAAAKWPNQSAIQEDDIVLSYAEVADRALRLANGMLRHCRAGSGIIAFECSRGIDAYIAVLGILAAGKTFLPISKFWPKARQDAVLGQTNPDLVIGIEELADLSHPPLPAPRPPCEHAYVLFTSGSTGKPKGIAIRHPQVLSYLESISSLIPLAGYDRVSQTFDLAFDLSVHDLFTTWGAGACLVHVSNHRLFVPSRTVNELGLTVWFSTPSVVARSVNSLEPMPKLRESIFCGEGLPVDTARAWQKYATGSRIHNIYGPTEATIGITILSCMPQDDIPGGANDLVPIGHVIPPNETKLSENREMLLRGPQVTDTYLDGGRCSTNGWYATGDLVALGPSGFEFLGRCDDQIKLRGFRVELNEVTQLLRDQTKSRVITLAWPPPPKPAEMIFSFVEKENITPTQMIKLVEACRLQLPEYMVPFDIFAVQPFPLTANGKIDFESLRKIIDKSLA